MLNRRHLRIKVLQALYAFHQAHNTDKYLAEKDLFKNVEHIYELYLYWLLTFQELAFIEGQRLEALKSKRIKTEEDLNPNLKFVNNRVFQLLKDNLSLKSAAGEAKISWMGDEEQVILQKVMAGIRESEIYTLYMASTVDSFEEDLKFAVEIFKENIANSVFVLNFFEEKSIQWLDDIDLCCSMVLKTLKTFTAEGDNRILPLYKENDDEKDFIRRLFSSTIDNFDKNNELISSLIDNWELDRLAIMDVLLMNLAITEVQVFGNIPEKVTLNEYIEISKYYSTPKSKNFINGILDKAFTKLKSEGKIVKTERGLL